MHIAIIDPFAGISGDMTLGSLVDLAGNSIWLEELPAKLGVPEVGVRIARTTRCSLSATKVDFDIPEAEAAEGHHHDHGRSVGELKAIVERSPLSTPVKRRASEVFGLIGEAEGRIHGVSPDEVHLHEVGALDALLDVVGVLVGFEHLAVETVYNLPVAIGTPPLRPILRADATRGNQNRTADDRADRSIRVSPQTYSTHDLSSRSCVPRSSRPRV